MKRKKIAALVLTVLMLTQSIPIAGAELGNVVPQTVAEQEKSENSEDDVFIEETQESTQDMSSILEAVTEEATEVASVQESSEEETTEAASVQESEEEETTEAASVQESEEEETAEDVSEQPSEEERTTEDVPVETTQDPESETLVETEIQTSVNLDLSALASENSTISSAKSISLNSEISGSISEANPQRFYKFELPTSGCVNLTGTYYFEWETTVIYDSKGNEVWTADNVWNEIYGAFEQDVNIYLTSGTYYFCVERWNRNYWGYCYGSYKFKIGLTSSNESFKEPQNGNNNTKDSADAIQLNTTYRGQLALNDRTDFYKFTLPTSGCINLTGTYKIEWQSVCIYDSKGNELWAQNNTWNDTYKAFKQNEEVELTSGTYYYCVKVCDRYYNGNLRYGSYDFKISFTSANESFKEPENGNNNVLSSANAINLNTTYRGQLALNDHTDFYKFTLPTSGCVNLTGSYKIPWERTRIYDIEGNEMWSSDNIWNDVSKTFVQNKKIELISGTYYYCVEAYNRNYNGYRYGSYDFMIGFTSANESFLEKQGQNNNSIVDANQIWVGSAYAGQLAINDTVDFYKISISSFEKYTLSISAGDMADIRYYMYDQNGEQLLEQTVYDNGDTGIIAYQKTYSIQPGTYYLALQKKSSYGSYLFCLNKGSNPSAFTGWTKVSGNWYYILSNGAKKTGWLRDGNNWYYLNSTGAMVIGWQRINQKWYYFNAYGAMQTGWLKIGNTRYYLKSEGDMVTGWYRIAGNWYYFSVAGEMKTGWIWLSGNWYYLQSSGAMVTGWKNVNGKWYYFNDGGQMKTGWICPLNKWYYLQSDGAMVTGWKNINSKWYFFNYSGEMQTGWIKYNNRWYYLQADGVMVTGSRYINGKWYYFDASGAMK